jgi:hypothetical protein
VIKVFFLQREREAGELRKNRRCEDGSEQRGAPGHHAAGFKVKEGAPAQKSRLLLETRNSEKTPEWTQICGNIDFYCFMSLCLWQ